MTPSHSPTLFQRAVLAGTGAVLALIGYLALSDPAEFLKTMQMAEAGPAAFNEIRGQYGGFCSAAALLLFASALGKVSVRAGLWLCLVMYAGILTGRVLHLAVFGGWADFASYTITMQAVHLIEVAGLAATCLALREG